MKYWRGGGKKKNPPETLFIPVCETGARRQHFVNTRPIKIKNLVLQLASSSPEMPRKQRRTHKKFKSRLVSSISASDRPGPVWILNSLLVLDSQSTSAGKRRDKGRRQNNKNGPVCYIFSTSSVQIILNVATILKAKNLKWIILCKKPSGEPKSAPNSSFHIHAHIYI